MTSKKWFISCIALLLAALVTVGGMVFFVDPFFHYRAPNKALFYRLYDQRSQNDGITKHFDYDAIITGTSMAENFKASQFEELFGVKTIKVVYSGATYKETNDNLKVSYESGHDPKYVVKPLDYSLLVRDKDELRLDMGEYPDYLTNSNPFDDVKYLFNKDVFLRYTLRSLLWYFQGKDGGYTSFDEYSNTSDEHVYGKDYVLAGRKKFKNPKQVLDVTDEEYEMVLGNVRQNVVEIAKEHPETTFIYFFPPYSMAYFGELRENGELSKMIRYKQAAIEEMLECENIHIYSFSLHTDITADLDRYRDVAHYDSMVNEDIIELIYECESGLSAENAGISDRITNENKDEYYRAEEELLLNFDYNQLVG